MHCLADCQSDDEVKMSNTVLNASFVNNSSVEHKEGLQFSLGFPCGSAGKEYSCNVGDLGSIPRLRRSLWRREWLPTLVCWPGEFHGLYSQWGFKELDTTE